MNKPVPTPLTDDMTPAQLYDVLIHDATERLAYLRSLYRDAGDGYVLWNEYALRSTEFVDGKWVTRNLEDAPVYPKLSDLPVGYKKLRAYDGSPVEVLPRRHALMVLGGKLNESLAMFKAKREELN